MKQYRAWYTGDNPPLLFEMVYVSNDELYFRMASDHEIKYDFKVPFIDTDWIVEEAIEYKGVTYFEGDRVRILYTDWMSQTDYSISLEEYKKSISDYGTIVFHDFGFKISLDKKDRYGDLTYGSIDPGTHGEIEKIGNIRQGENP